MQAFVKGDLPVPGTAFTCVSCHLRSGLGSVEGGVVTPPTTGKKLFVPLEFLYKGTEQNKKYFPLPPRRPAYTEASLAESLRYGIDPNGRILNDVMPRYQLGDGEMSLLIDYLKALSSELSPGVTETTIRFATIITDDVSAEDSATLLAALDEYVKTKNNVADMYVKQPRKARMAEKMLESKELLYRKLQLSRWILKGPPETWRSQLEEYNQKDPVFAILGGISSQEWRPIHTFCEDFRIPCLFPITDFPVISTTDWYTLYLSKGYYQEGESTARYLNDLPENSSLVQIMRVSPAGQALAQGFEETWQEIGRKPPVTITIKSGESLSKETLEKMLATEKPAAVVIWDDAAAGKLLELMAASPNRPARFFLSSSYQGKSFWSLPESLRDTTFLTYPYRLPQDETKPLMNSKNFPADTKKITKQAYPITQVLTMALMDMKGNYYRDNFLDVIGMIMDQTLPLYERLSFGPGQRYAAKGCYIVQLGKGEKPQLIKKSDWVIH